jgi:hypothetical protein
MHLVRAALATALLAGAATPGRASLCDYRLSNIIGGAAATRAVRATGGVLKETGVLTLNNAVTGATMLGSTLSGSSAASGAAAAGAGTVGIAVGAALLGSEAICYFLDDRITGYSEVLMIMSMLADQADPEFFALITPETPLEKSDYILVRNPETGNRAKYMVRDLYIVNGVLKNRDPWRNTVIGTVGAVSAN